ncbi:hypothetical protein BH11PSE11_BH11PSE11_29020 [soil metagenome]
MHAGGFLMLLKIGDLAKRAGLSVRTLHHYDAVGLLSPSERTESGSRLYGRKDLIRLHRILALKHLGYSLSEIRVNLDDPAVKPVEIIERQIQELEDQARQAGALSESLRQLASRIVKGRTTDAADWLNLLEVMAMYRKHLTDHEMRILHNPAGNSVAEIDASWARLVAEVEHAMRAQMPVESADAQALAWRWIRLVIATTSNNPAIANKLKAMHEHEARAQEIVGIGPEKFTWIGQAFAHARTALFANYLEPAELLEVRQRQLARMSHMDEWPDLVEQVRRLMEQGLSADAPAMQALALRWQQLFRDSYCGDDRALEAKIRHAFAIEPDLRIGVGVDAALLAYLRLAMEYLLASQASSAE